MRWPPVQLRRIARLEYGDSLAAEDREDGDVPVYGSNGVVGFHAQPNTGAPAIIVGRKGSYGKLQLTERPAFAIDTTYFIDPRVTKADIRWLHYALSTLGLDEVSQDTGVPGLSRDVAYGQRLPLPSLTVQRAIADFLDAETARIDALIAKKRRMIDLLDERRQATIDVAVEVPGTLVAVRHLVDRITSGPRGWSDRTGEEGAPFLRITNVQRTSITLSRRDLLRVKDPGTAEANRTRVVAGDVLVSITADIGSVGVATEEDEGGFVSQHIALLTPSACESEWLAYAIKSTRAQQTLDSGQYGGTKTQLSLGDIAELKVPCPGPTIRAARLQALRARISSIEAGRQALASQIALLQEHRQALITAAVTGDLEVPGVAA